MNEPGTLYEHDDLARQLADAADDSWALLSTPARDRYRAMATAAAANEDDEPTFTLAEVKDAIRKLLGNGPIVERLLGGLAEELIVGDAQ